MVGQIHQLRWQRRHRSAIARWFVSTNLYANIMQAGTAKELALCFDMGASRRMRFVTSK
jgi:hypothetical protein